MSAEPRSLPQFVGVEGLIVGILDLFPRLGAGSLRRKLTTALCCIVCCLIDLSMVTQVGTWQGHRPAGPTLGTGTCTCPQDITSLRALAWGRSSRGLLHPWQQGVPTEWGCCGCPGGPHATGVPVIVRVLWVQRVPVARRVCVPARAPVLARLCPCRHGGAW